MRIGILATRPLCGRMIGRKQVLRTMLQSMERLGHEVLFLPMARKGHQRSCPHCQGALLQTPSAPRILWNTLTRFAGGSFCLNECLFWNPRQLPDVRRLLAACDLVIVDMLRMAPYAAGLGRPVVLDLDDLLSKRYSQWAAQRHGTEQILGYYRDLVGRSAGQVLSGAARRMLRVEAHAIGRREGYWARQADAVCLVSAREAAELSARIDRPVFAVPMAVDVPEASRLAPPTSSSLAFLGGLDFQPNVQALRYFRDQVRPALAARGLENIPLHVLGHAPAERRGEFEGHRFIFEGYVEDLTASLRRHALFVAPITQGTGIKTKVLDAMAHQMAVVGTPNAFAGLEVTDGTHALVGRDAGEFADRIAFGLSSRADAERIGRGGRALVLDGFTREQVARKWKEVLEAAQAHFASRSAHGPAAGRPLAAAAPA